MQKLNKMLRDEHNGEELPKEEFRELSNLYRRMKREKIRDKQKEMQSLAIVNMKENPRAFYKMIKTKGSDISAKINLETWEQHAKGLYTSELEIHNVEMEIAPHAGADLFTVKDMEQAITRLKNHKAADQFDMKAEYLKLLTESELPRIMAHINNRLVKDGVFPRTWMEAEVRPLHKRQY